MGGYYGDFDTFIKDEDLIGKRISFFPDDRDRQFGTIKYIIEFNKDYIVGIELQSFLYQGILLDTLSHLLRQKFQIMIDKEA